MPSRNQYLNTLVEQRGYHLLSKKEKSCLLDEYCRSAGQNRNYVIRKIRSGRYRTAGFGRRKRKEVYDGRVRAALVACWRIFDYPCGQRLAPILKTEVERLRRLDELRCSDEIARKLEKIAPSTIDVKLRRQREVEQRKPRSEKVHPLLYQKVPTKVFGEQDRGALGTIQIDLVEHCGQSAAGEYAHTVSTTDIATGWWEGGAVLGRGQQGVWQAIDEARSRYPFSWTEIHPDNDTAFINHHLYRYCEKERLGFSRSRPYKKNDNALVEQKNGTHVRRVVGHLRYDTEQERDAINGLYADLRLFKNFFQPVMKLVSKERVGGKLHRRYDAPRTPYQRVLEGDGVPQDAKDALARTYASLNPAALKRSIDVKLNRLWKIYQAKQNAAREPEPRKKQRPRSLTSYMRQREAVHLLS